MGPLPLSLCATALPLKLTAAAASCSTAASPPPRHSRSLHQSRRRQERITGLLRPPFSPPTTPQSAAAPYAPSLASSPSTPSGLLPLRFLRMLPFATKFEALAPWPLRHPHLLASHHRQGLPRRSPDHPPRPLPQWLPRRPRPLRLRLPPLQALLQHRHRSIHHFSHPTPSLSAVVENGCSGEGCAGGAPGHTPDAEGRHGATPDFRVQHSVALKVIFVELLNMMVFALEDISILSVRQQREVPQRPELVSHRPRSAEASGYGSPPDADPGQTLALTTPGGDPPRAEPMRINYARIKSLDVMHYDCSQIY